MRILESSFLASASSVHNAPSPTVAEIAMLGRSNVGKSSLINLLLANKLAKSSSTPGKTRLINFYDLVLSDDSNLNPLPLRMIDLPGFGYAKVSKSELKKWESVLLEFIESRASIKVFCYLIDSRHIDLPIDTRTMGLFSQILKGDQEIVKIYTKFDKLKSNQQKNIAKHGLTSSISSGFREKSFASIWGALRDILIR